MNWMKDSQIARELFLKQMKIINLTVKGFFFFERKLVPIKAGPGLK